MSVRKQVLLCLVLILLGGAGWLAYRGLAVGETTAAAAGGPASARGGIRVPGLGGAGGPINVIAGPVAVEDAGETVKALGTAKASRSVTIFPQVAGVVKEVLFTPGDAVAAGAPLVRLEDDEQSVAVDRARIAEADAQSALERSRRLQQSRTVTAVAFSEAESTAQVAAIELKTAEIALTRRTLTAPFAGMAGLSDVSVGDVVSTTTQIVTLDDLATIRVDFEVPERLAGRVTRGQPVTAVAQGLPGSGFEGRIAALDTRVDEATRTLKLQAEFGNGDARLKPGMAVTVVLQFELPGQISVPSLAVQWDRRGSFVWKIADGTVKRTDIAIISRLSGSVVVTGDLKPGDRVVTEGVQRLRDGSAVAEIGNEPAADPNVSPGTGAPAMKARS